jgi:cytochrome c oxidase subunit 2
MRVRARLGLAAALLVILAAIPAIVAVSSVEPRAAAQTQGPTERPFTLTARRYSFTPQKLEVFQGDLVRIELSTEDIAHSLTIDDYRISKRVGPGQPVTFEFRAEQVGTFPFYCDLLNEDGCRKMRGEMVVKPRP